MTRSMSRPAIMRATMYYKNYVIIIKIFFEFFTMLDILTKIFIMLCRTLLGFLVPWRKSHLKVSL